MKDCTIITLTVFGRLSLVQRTRLPQTRLAVTQTVNSKTLEKVSVSTTFAQSHWVSVLTTSIFLSLDESRSRQLKKIRVSMGLGLDNFEKSESRWVSVSTTLKNQSLDESRSRQLWKSESRSQQLRKYSLIESPC